MSTSADPTPLLEMRRISKTFSSVHALTDVSLTVYPGEVHILMGENGAGKSTLMKVLAGAFPADPGSEILIGGRPAGIVDPLSAKSAGVAIIYQELALAPNLTVLENIYLGREPRRGPMIDRSRMSSGAETLAKLGASFGPETLVSDLSIAERQLVEIARAIDAKSRILVMDEPTTALSSRETERLFELVARLKAEGLAIIYITHRMAEVYELADRVSVLRDGRYVGTLVGEDIKPEKIVHMMVGRDLSSFYKKAHSGFSAGKVMLDVSNLSDGRRVKNGGFQLHQGEVLGLAGLVGAGRTELARLIYAAEPRAAGTVKLDGREMRFRGPKQATDNGVVYLTEDRKGHGLFLDMSVGDNVNLQVMERDSKWGGWLHRRRGRQRTAHSIRTLAIRVSGPDADVGSLSGGNQQKVLLSRLLETQPKVLLLDEPTRGVDVGAKSEIYRIIDDLAGAGVAVLVISSELPEIVGICDRVVVMREGVTVGEVGGHSGVPITEQSIMALATGVELSQRVA
ncbi:MAG: sugar ABC transporter ATP-binding protein [Ancalomicrobiaceae bacterium]|nr:sugar ABC transporter ATP-binding protein [Ancalomicrobiaceae bacterium]